MAVPSLVPSLIPGLKLVILSQTPWRFLTLSLTFQSPESRAPRPGSEATAPAPCALRALARPPNALGSAGGSCPRPPAVAGPAFVLPGECPVLAAPTPSSLHGDGLQHPANAILWTGRVHNLPEAGRQRRAGQRN